MKRFATILKYLKDQKQNIVLYFVFNLLSILFSLISLAMLAPFLQLLFGKEQLLKQPPALRFSAASVTGYLKYVLGVLIQHHNKVYALAAICVIVMLSIFFKNIFLYFSYRVLAPL